MFLSHLNTYKPRLFYINSSKKILSYQYDKVLKTMVPKMRTYVFRWERNTYEYIFNIVITLLI